MARWEGNARDRLTRAALELFAERGYEATTVADIAERAGLTKSTFFRHFDDKREILAGGLDAMVDAVTVAVDNVPSQATMWECLTAALDALTAFFPIDHRPFAASRQRVVAATPELYERELLKRARLEDALADVLRARGRDETTARLGAAVATTVFQVALSRWLARSDRRGFARVLTDVLAEASVRIAGLGPGA